MKFQPPHLNWNVVTVNGDAKVVTVLTRRCDVTESMIVPMAVMNLIVVGFSLLRSSVMFILIISVKISFCVYSQIFLLLD